MTKRNDPSDDEALSALYQQRKSRYLAPNNVQTNIREQLNIRKPAATRWWRINLLPYAQISAVSATIAIALIVIGWQVIEQRPGLITQPTALHTLALNDYQTVEIHTFAPTSSLPLSSANARARYEESLLQPSLSSPANTTARQVQYQHAQSIYLARQNNLNVHQQSDAKVLPSDEGLVLLTCDKLLLQLSQDVVDMLMNGLEEKEIDFSAGKMLALAFDDKGHIIDITQQKSKTQC